jgi:hypothetical protein
MSPIDMRSSDSGHTPKKQKQPLSKEISKKINKLLEKDIKKINSKKSPSK